MKSNVHRRDIRGGSRDIEATGRDIRHRAEIFGVVAEILGLLAEILRLHQAKSLLQKIVSVSPRLSWLSWLSYRDEIAVTIC
jgi:hypothetical protein